MWEVPGWVVVTALAVPTVLLVGCVARALTGRGRPLAARSEPRRRFWDRWLWVAVAVVAVVLVVGGLPWPVLLVAAAGNALFGRHENIPFSHFAMFSRPPSSGWYLRLERLNGKTMRVKRARTNSTVIKKRFHTEFRRLGGLQLSEPDEIAACRAEAGEVLADWLERRLENPEDERARRLARRFRIVHVEVCVRDGEVAVERQVVAERNQGWPS